MKNPKLAVKWRGAFKHNSGFKCFHFLTFLKTLKSYHLPLHLMPLKSGINAMEKIISLKAAFCQGAKGHFFSNSGMKLSKVLFL